MDGRGKPVSGGVGLRSWLRGFGSIVALTGLASRIPVIDAASNPGGSSTRRPKTDRLESRVAIRMLTGPLERGETRICEWFGCRRRPQEIASASNVSQVLVADRTCAQQTGSKGSDDAGNPGRQSEPPRFPKASPKPLEGRTGDYFALYTKQALNASTSACAC